MFLFSFFYLHFLDTHDVYPHPRPTTSTHDPRQLVILASGQTESDENANTEELSNHFMALEGNRKLPQHKPQNYNSTAETNEGLNPQFNALYSSQRSYNALRKDQQTNSRDNTISSVPLKQIAGPGSTKAAR